MTTAELLAKLRNAKRGKFPLTVALAAQCEREIRRLAAENARLVADVESLTASLSAEVTESERVRGALEQIATVPQLGMPIRHIIEGNIRIARAALGEQRGGE